MAEQINHASSYVKLTKEQAPVDEINPGELNQPIDVPQLRVQKCSDCGQVLPESYRAPADEPWTSGIFDCAKDTNSCWTGLFCPCVLFGRNIEQLRDDNTSWKGPCICHAIFVEGGLTFAAIITALPVTIDPGTLCIIYEALFYSWWLCGIYTGRVRQSVQKKYHLKNSPCDPCLVHCCMHWCALCQEHRELKQRLILDDGFEPTTVVSPPPVQEMNASSDRASPPSTNGDERGNLEMQAL